MSQDQTSTASVHSTTSTPQNIVHGLPKEFYHLCTPDELERFRHRTFVVHHPAMTVEPDDVAARSAGIVATTTVKNYQDDAYSCQNPNWDNDRWR